MDEETCAQLLELALARRPERVANLVLSGLSAEQAKEIACFQEVLALLPQAEAAMSPGPELRTRLVRTLEARAPRSAVLVVDMLNDHLTPGSILEVPRARDVVAPLQRRLDEARTRGVPVVYVLDEHDAGDADLDDWGNHALAGTPGAEVWPALAPREGDRIVRKPSYSGFFQSNLEAVLDELRVDTLVLTGCSTEVQLMTTATDALQKGFAVSVPADTQAGLSVETEAATLATLQLLVPYAPARHQRLARART